MPVDDAEDILGDNLDPVPDCGDGVDIVSTDADSKPKRGDNRWLRLERERKQLSKQLKAKRLAELVVVQKLSFRESAEAIGCSYQHVVHTLWPLARELTAADFMEPAEKERIALLISDVTQHVIRTASEKMGEHAAYGMVALNGCKQLAEMHGIDFKATGDAAGALATIEEVAQSVLEHAPLLASNIEKIQRIKERQRLAIEEARIAEKR